MKKILPDIHIRRFSRLLAVDFQKEGASYGWTMATIAIIYLFLNAFSGWLFQTDIYMELFYFPSLFVGIIFTCRCFQDIHNQDRAKAYLMIPCSSEEKFLSKWVTSLSYLPILFVSFCAMAVVGESINYLLFDMPFQWIGEIFRPRGDVHFLVYLFFHSFFFMGSIVFRRNVFIKVSFLGSIFFLTLIAIVTYIRLKYVPFPSDLTLKEMLFGTPGMFFYNFQRIVNFYWSLLESTFYYSIGFAVFFSLLSYIATYWRLRNKQLYA